MASGDSSKKQTETDAPIWIYVDDSNIWIEAKKFASQQKKFKTKEDHRVRIEIGRLTDVVAKQRPVAQGFLYGSEPPPVDTVWQKIKQKGWKVDSQRRSRMTGKEKKIDTQLVADVTERVITEKQLSTVVLITGDADAIPAIEMALKYDWNVEVYMWKQATSSDLRKLHSKNQRKFKLEFLDDYLGQVTFTNLKLDLEHNQHLLPYIRKSGVVLAMEKGTFQMGVPPKWWCSKVESIAQFPFQYYWIEDNKGNRSDDLLLYFRGDEQHVFDVVEFTTSLNEFGELDFVANAQPYLQYEQDKKKIYQLATCGRFYYEDILEYNADSDSMCSDNEEDPFKLVRYHHRRSKQRYSEPCEYKFNCKFGTGCNSKHTPEELRFFRNNMGKGKAYRKVKPCTHHPNCHKKKEECLYAHGEEDAWCLFCCGNKGHFTNNCDQKDTV